jgi:hypothetical protein
MNKQVKHMSGTIPDSVKSLWEEYQWERDIDESDLIIFRLMGATFEYSAVEFNPPCESVESGVS